MSRICLFLITIIFSLAITPAFAAPKSNKKEPPTRITSDIIDIKRKSQIMEFIGHVVVKKGPDSMISERMVVFYDEKKDDKAPNQGSNQGPSSNKAEQGSSIKRIEAKSNVKIFNAEMVATGDSGYYDPKEEIFVLENNVVVNNGSSIGKGEKFIYNLTTQKGNFAKQTSEEVIVDKTNASKVEKPKKKDDDRIIFVISNDDLKKKKGDNNTENKPSIKNKPTENE